MLGGRAAFGTTSRKRNPGRSQVLEQRFDDAYSAFLSVGGKQKRQAFQQKCWKTLPAQTRESDLRPSQKYFSTGSGEHFAKHIDLELSEVVRTTDVERDIRAPLEAKLSSGSGKRVCFEDDHLFPDSPDDLNIDGEGSLSEQAHGCHPDGPAPISTRTISAYYPSPYKQHEIGGYRSLYQTENDHPSKSKIDESGQPGKSCITAVDYIS
ncbi:unnamed protein product [Owenia fusiformis]|uniref:Uncharacterized protein n=1 Tax=Owenia fusiformis TaxID=6347 RepID=A0A8J1XVI2_OWEFU|nr:unnamed protein product [Owenia fusiformis]